MTSTMPHHRPELSYGIRAARGILNLTWGILATLLCVLWTAISALLAALFDGCLTR